MLSFPQSQLLDRLVQKCHLCLWLWWWETCQSPSLCWCHSPRLTRWHLLWWTLYWYRRISVELPVKFCSVGYHRLTSCRWGGSQAVRFSKEGAIDLVIRFPTAYSITACCFGGKNDLMCYVHPFDYMIMQVQIIINYLWLRHTVERMEVIQVCRKSTLTPATFFVLIWVQGGSKGVLDIGSPVKYSGTLVVQAIL